MNCFQTSSLSRQRTRHGFSLIELIVVIAVAMLLTGLMLPALNKLRENVLIVLCASQQRQLGGAMSMFAANSGNSNLPVSILLNDPNWKPEELMLAYSPETFGWDGLGILFQKEYCGAFECFYCPSHPGAHTPSSYASAWETPGSNVIYTTYHYAGHRDWITKRVRHFRDASSLVLLTDALRTTSDINHRFGMNVLYGDLSVRWRSDLITVFSHLPEDESDVGVDSEQRYMDIWAEIQKLISPSEE